MKIKNIILTKKGSALISTLVAAGLLSISSISLIQYMNNFKKTTANTIERINVDPLLRQTVLNNIKSLLIEQSGNAKGICHLVKAPAVSTGVTKVQLGFKNISRDFNLTKWKKYFPSTQWEFVDTNVNCKKIIPNFKAGPFNHCLKKLNVNNKIIFVIAKIIPKEFPSLKTIDIKQTNKLYDVKSVVFQLKTSVSVLNKLISPTRKSSTNIQNPEYAKNNQQAPTVKKSNYISHQSDVIWASSIGECYITSHGKTFIVKLSATGPGSTLPQVLNSLKYNQNTCEQKLQFSEINEDLVQVGQQTGLQLAAVTNLNARLACTKKVFRCKQAGHQDQDFDDLKFSFGFINEDSSLIPINKFNVTLKKGVIGSTQELDNTENEQLDRVPINFSTTYATSMANKDKNFNLYRGSHSLNIVAKKPTSSRYCGNICNTYTKSDKSSYTYPFVNMYENKGANSCKFTKDFSTNESNRIRCIVCHTKACHRFGVGTFGPYKTERVSSTESKLRIDTTIYGLNEEALDAQLPECESKYSYEYSRFVPSKIPSVTRAEDDTGTRIPTGIVIQLDTQNIIADFKKINNFNSDGNSLIYKNENAKSQLPVLCFTKGKFLPAMQINPNNLLAPKTVVTATFADAAKACQNIGKELGNQYNLALKLYTSYNEPTFTAFHNIVVQAMRYFVTKTGEHSPISNINNRKDKYKYSFINNANTGMFIAPSVYNNDQQRIKKQGHFTQKEKHSLMALAHLFTNKPTKLWVAAGADISNVNVVAPPSALISDKNSKFKDNFSVFFDKKDNTKLIILEDTKTFNNNDSNLALTYNIHYKGLVPVAANTQLRFVCYSKRTNKYFITQQIGNIQRGNSICESHRGLFIPPKSGMDWTKLMLSLNPNDESYPFPNPLTNSEKKPNKYSVIYSKNVATPMAWVALKKINNSGKIEVQNLKISPHSILSSVQLNSIFTASLNNKQIIDKLFSDTTSTTVVINTKGVVLKDTQKTPGQYKKICYNKNSINYHNRSWVLIPLNRSCPANAPTTVNISRTTLGSFFKPLSYTFVSQWLKQLSHLTSYQIVLNPNGLVANAEKEKENMDIHTIKGGIYTVTPVKITPTTPPPPPPPRGGCDQISGVNGYCHS